jgi:hypothetical protein
MVMLPMHPLPGTRVKGQEYLTFAGGVEQVQSYEGRLVVGCRRTEQGDLVWCVLFTSSTCGTCKLDGSWSPWLQMCDDGEDEVVTFSSFEQARAAADRYDALLTLAQLHAAQPHSPHLDVEDTLEGENFSGMGDTAYVPLDLPRRCGMRAACWQTTGIGAIHIIHYSPDEWVKSGGEQGRGPRTGQGV